MLGLRYSLFFFGFPWLWWQGSRADRRGDRRTHRLLDTLRGVLS